MNFPEFIVSILGGIGFFLFWVLVCGGGPWLKKLFVDPWFRRRELKIEEAKLQVDLLDKQIHLEELKIQRLDSEIRGVHADNEHAD